MFHVVLMDEERLVYISVYVCMRVLMCSNVCMYVCVCVQFSMYWL